MSLALLVGLTSSVWAASSSVVEETLYHDFQKVIQSQNKLKTKSFVGFSSFDQSLFVDALWDLADENSPAALEFLNNEIPLHYDLAQKLRLGILRIKYKRAAYLPNELNNELATALQSPTVDLPIIYLISAVFNVGANIYFIPRYSFYGSAVITWVSEAIILFMLIILAINSWKKKYA